MTRNYRNTNKYAGTQRGIAHGIRGTVRVYKVTDNGSIEDCCHDSNLEMIEHLKGFDQQTFFAKFPQPLAPGYYWVDHASERGNYVSGTFENLLKHLAERGLFQ